ncbi:MAG: hypothetical protein MHPSP_004330, partial [Paramarteilia canceri]
MAEPASLDTQKENEILDTTNTEKKSQISDDDEINHVLELSKELEEKLIKSPDFNDSL